jgi:hypothetical protein
MADIDNAISGHNLFARVAENLVVVRVATDRSLGGRKLTSQGNHVQNLMPTWKPSQLLPTVPALKGMETDGEYSVPGPFPALANPAAVRLE